MKPFLKELAEKIYKANPQIELVTLVVPNRRAALYFRKYLSELLNKPSFAPEIITIEDFISKFSTLLVPDKLKLIHELYKVYQQTIQGEATETAEPFDQFYFWGEMLLRDFDEADKYMVNVEHLFKDLSHQKELDSNFDYLTEEQRNFLKGFWSTFEESETANKRRFLYIWRKLPEVYTAFRSSLLSKNQGYDGMVHRLVAEDLSRVKSGLDKRRKLKFAGFNALTKAEENILSHFVEHHDAEVFWDIDDYYVNNKIQEAGVFFREYQNHPVLKRTFNEDIPSNLSSRKISKNAINLYGAAQPIGQAKLMAQILEEEFSKGTLNPEETLIVLPDEKLMIPVLHGIPSAIEKLNVTMGFPLSSTPLFNLLEIILDLQISRKDDFFNHRQTLSILGHPYVVSADPASSNNKRKEILRHNWVSIPKNFLATEHDLHRAIFTEFEKDSLSVDVIESILEYLRRIVTQVGALNTISDFDKEFCLQFLKMLNQIQGILVEETKHNATLDRLTDRKERQKALKSFLRLFRQLCRGMKLPFSGEPLRGLQIMGVLETRNLDYKNVFILSLNEGSFPSNSSKGSYVPFNIRRAYNLPTAEHQDAMYSYLFYRVLQRAEHIHLFYNSETDVLGQGEMSRYLQQLIYESGIPIEKRILDNPISPQSILPIVVIKDQSVIEDLFKLNEGNNYFKGVSPSALNTYIECRLKFYFRHVARIKEPKEVEEELDARVLGNFLHHIMERFYKNISAKKTDRYIEKEDLLHYKKEIDRLIDEIFIENYRLDPEKEVTYEGQRLVVKEVVKRFIDRIIEMDQAYAPFYIEGLEQEGLTYELKIDQPPYKAVISGKIDRVDRKDDVLRVIDYKTGKDKLNFDSVASLFSRSGIRNKAAFQTLLYALLYKRTHLSDGRWNNAKLVPGLINRLNLFDEGFSFGLKVGKDNVTDVEPLLPEFEARLHELFNELFDPQKPFDQTGELSNCKLCPYTQLCYR
jgi:CRISPR/Cas system-associated exonuclease Cas4 (RecB family)